MTAVETKVIEKARAGEKFTADEVVADAALMSFAHDYVKMYVGNFEFMNDLKRSLRKGLTAGQAKGALNVHVAEIKRVLATAEAPTETYVNVVTFFANVTGLKWPKVRMDEVVFRGRNDGSVDVTSSWKEWNDRFNRDAPHWYGRIEADGTVRFGKGWNSVKDVVAEFNSDPEGVARAYGKRTGNCCFCSRELETKESLAVGYGPICADKFGLPWGELVAA